MGVYFRLVAQTKLRVCPATRIHRVLHRFNYEVRADIGYLSSGVILWAVLAPTTNLGQGALGGHYGGATASAAVGVGAGANVLVGGFNSSIALQPVSIEGQNGLNVAAGVAEMTLKFNPSKPAKKHSVVKIFVISSCTAEAVEWPPPFSFSTFSRRFCRNSNSHDRLFSYEVQTFEWKKSATFRRPVPASLGTVDASYSGRRRML